MDYFWIIILIAGAIISSMQNDRKKKRRPSTPTKPAEAGETDLSQEWERRMRDVFGEQHPLTPPAPKGSERRTAAPNRGTDTEQTLAQAMARQSVSAERAAIQKPKSHKKTAKATVDIKQQPLPNAPAEPKKTRQNADYGRIIDEFDLERAVIYSEILKPKFEEY